MKTITIDTYKFDELFEEAKIKAIADYHEGGEVWRACTTNHLSATDNIKESDLNFTSNGSTLIDLN